MDQLVRKLVGFGVPGLVMVIIVGTLGCAGGAAIVAALAILGGPFGMWGGILALGLIALITDGIAKFGLEKILKAVYEGLLEKGESKESIINKIKKIPITKDLKLKLLDSLKEL